MGKLIGATVEGAVVGLLLGPVGLAIWAGLYILYGVASLAAYAIIANERR